MDSYDILAAELQGLATVPRDFAAATASESQARRDLADNERRLEVAKIAIDNATLEVEATSKMSRRVSGLLTGKSREYKREAELAGRAAKSAQEKHVTLLVAVEAQRGTLAKHGANLALLEEKLKHYSELADRLDAVYTETVGPLTFPANDALTLTLRTAQSELEQCELAALVERETMTHLGKAFAAMNKAIEEIDRGNVLLGRDRITTNKMAEAWRNAQNFANAFRDALREVHAMNGAIRFTDEILVPRPQIRTGQPGDPSQDSFTDVLIYEQSQKCYKKDVLLRDFFRSDEIARGELRLHAAESRMRQARSALLIVEQTIREDRRKAYLKQRE